MTALLVATWAPIGVDGSFVALRDEQNGGLYGQNGWCGANEAADGGARRVAHQAADQVLDGVGGALQHPTERVAPLVSF
jgi:hypothetical protein